MNKTIAFVVGCCVASCFSGGGSWAGTDSVKPPALASADWSVKSPHSLALNPPSLDLVQSFVNAAFGSDVARVCAFRFADLHQSATLSLVISTYGGGTGGCNETDIFDKTPSGFEDYESSAVFSGGDDIQDINHDGKLELILWAPIAGPDEVGEECDWPLVFAWTGGGYTEASAQYKAYYERYLKSLDNQIAAYFPNQPAAKSTTVPLLSIGPGKASLRKAPRLVKVPVPAPSSPAATEAAYDSDYACDRVQAAKTEQFLGIHSDASMIPAIKDSESNNPDRRILAAVILSFMKTPEAKADLKTLANDSDPEVAKPAKDLLSEGTEPDDYYREVKMEPVQWPAATR